MMHPHHQSISSSASLSAVQRDRERQREREQRRQQVLANQTGQNQIINPILTTAVEKSVLFPIDPVRLEQEDDTSKEIKSTLGEFGKLMPFLTNNSLNYSAEVNSNLVGISRNEINRRRVNEIFAEMTRNIPSKPITGLDDLMIENNAELSQSSMITNHHQKNQASSSAMTNVNRLIESNTHFHSHPQMSSPYSTLQHQIHNIAPPTVTQSQQPSNIKSESEEKINNIKSVSLSSSSSNDESTSSSSSEDDSDDNDDDDSSGDSESSGDGDSDSNSDDQSNKINNKNRKRKSKDAPYAASMEVDARVKLKNSDLNLFHQNNNLNANNFDLMNNEDDDEEHKWDLDNFLPAGAAASSSQDHKNTQANSTKYNQDTLNNNQSLDYIEQDRTPSKSKNDYKTTLLNNKTKNLTIKKQTKSTNNRLVNSKISEDSDDGSHNSDSDQDNNNKHASDDYDSNDSLKKRPVKRHQDDDEEMEEGELDEDNQDNPDIDEDLEDSRYRSRSNASLSVSSIKSDRLKNDASLLSTNRMPNHKSYPEPTKTTSNTNKLNNNNKKKLPPPLIQPIPPPPKFDDVLASSSTTLTKLKNRISNDENSWKDIKRRKDPASSSLSKSKSSDTNVLVNNNNIPVISDSKVIESKTSTNRLTTKITTRNPSPISNRKSKYSPHLVKKENPPSEPYTRKVELAPQPSTGFSNNDQLQQSLIVSIELPKLNRIPQVDRNGNLEPSPSKIKSDTTSTKKTKEFKSSSSSSLNQRSDMKYLNGKPTSLSLNSKTKSKPEASSKIKTEPDSVSRHGSSRHLSSSSHQPNVLSSQPPTSLPVTITMPNSINLKTSPVIHQSPNLPNHRSPMCQSVQEAQSRARTLKRKADSMKIPQQQILQYIEASMYFIQAGLIMEQKRIDAEVDKAYQLYRDTLAMIKVTTSKLPKNRPSNNEQSLIDLKLTILSYRCQALLNTRLTRMRGREIHENKEIIGQFLKSHEHVLGGHSSNPSSSNTNSTSSMTVPMQMLTLFSRQLFLLQHTYSANDLWIKSETMLETNPGAKEFFQQIDQECGGSLHLSSSIEQLIHHTLKGVKSIQVSLNPMLFNDIGNANQTHNKRE